MDSGWTLFVKKADKKTGFSLQNRGVGCKGDSPDYLHGDWLFLRCVMPRAQADDGKLKKIRRGWCLGGETFRQELLAQARAVAGESRVATLKIETEEQNEFNLEWN